MAKDVPPEFYNLADKFIHLANSLTEEHGVARVSAVFLFAASRYNAHCMLASDPEAEQNRQAAVTYFVEQYQKMLEDNIDWLRASQAGAPEG